MARRGQPPAPTKETRAPVVEQISYKRQALTEDEIAEIEEAFNLFDSDGSGSIDPKEIKAAIQSLGFEEKNAALNQMITDLERVGGEIDFPRFLNAMTAKIGG